MAKGQGKKDREIIRLRGLGTSPAEIAGAIGSREDYVNQTIDADILSNHASVPKLAGAAARNLSVAGRTDSISDFLLRRIAQVAGEDDWSGKMAERAIRFARTTDGGWQHIVDRSYRPSRLRGKGG